MDPQVQIRIEQFKSDLRSMEASAIVTKQIRVGDCFILDNHQEAQLLSVVAKHFALAPTDVFLVGSAKLGFSIAPNKRYLPFRNTSDIDIAIISSSLFDDIWFRVFRYAQTGAAWQWQQQFKDYLFAGWIRPDMLPRLSGFDIRKDWFEFFRSLTSSGLYGQYKIAAGLYKSWYFLEHYQIDSVQECKLKELEITP